MANEEQLHRDVVEAISRAAHDELKRQRRQGAFPEPGDEPLAAVDAAVAFMALVISRTILPAGEPAVRQMVKERMDQMLPEAWRLRQEQGTLTPMFPEPAGGSAWDE